MQNSFDLAVVLAIILVAGVYLLRRFSKAKQNPGAGCGCGSGCSACGSGDCSPRDDRKLPKTK